MHNCLERTCLEYTCIRLGSPERQVIEQAVNEFNKYTCLRFVPRSNQANYINIVKDRGCWSYLGMIDGMQELSLDNGCVFVSYSFKRILIHHVALGQCTVVITRLT